MGRHSTISTKLHQHLPNHDAKTLTTCPHYNFRSLQMLFTINTKTWLDRDNGTLLVITPTGTTISSNIGTTVILSVLHVQVSHLLKYYYFQNYLTLLINFSKII